VSETKAVAKKAVQEEEKKEEEPVLARRSSRNEGKVANYNIDQLIDASLDMDKGSIGGKCISVMLA
jgi:hypothetical protein